jgi:hypothetical protein
MRKRRDRAVPFAVPIDILGRCRPLGSGLVIFVDVGGRIGRGGAVGLGVFRIEESKGLDGGDLRVAKEGEFRGAAWVREEGGGRRQVGKEAKREGGDKEKVSDSLPCKHKRDRKRETRGVLVTILLWICCIMT